MWSWMVAVRCVIIQSNSSSFYLKFVPTHKAYERSPLLFSSARRTYAILSTGLYWMSIKYLTEYEQSVDALYAKLSLGSVTSWIGGPPVILGRSLVKPAAPLRIPSHIAIHAQAKCIKNPIGLGLSETQGHVHTSKVKRVSLSVAGNINLIWPAYVQLFCTILAKPEPSTIDLNNFCSISQKYTWDEGALKIWQAKEIPGDNTVPGVLITNEISIGKTALVMGTIVFTTDVYWMCKAPILSKSYDSQWIPFGAGTGPWANSMMSHIYQIILITYSIFTMQGKVFNIYKEKANHNSKEYKQHFVICVLNKAHDSCNQNSGWYAMLKVMKATHLQLISTATLLFTSLKDLCNIAYLLCIQYFISSLGDKREDSEWNKEDKELTASHTIKQLTSSKSKYEKPASKICVQELITSLISNIKAGFEGCVICKKINNTLPLYKMIIVPMHMNNEELQVINMGMKSLAGASWMQKILILMLHNISVLMLNGSHTTDEYNEIIHKFNTDPEECILLCPYYWGVLGIINVLMVNHSEGKGIILGQFLDKNKENIRDSDDEDDEDEIKIQDGLPCRSQPTSSAFASATGFLHKLASTGTKYKAVRIYGSKNQVQNIQRTGVDNRNIFISSFIAINKDLIVINDDLINPNPDNIEDANEQNVNANAVPSQRQQKYENDSIPADNDNIPEPDLIITGYQRALSIPANNNNASEPNLIINDSQRELSIPSLLSLNNATQGLPNNGDYVYFYYTKSDKVSEEEFLIVSCGPAIRVMYHFKEVKVLVRK
ncbi:uncharacterized protein BJ212DRAFT_1301773 [Suillus subaureus]|uniref:Uncharacterized protein n=1 Tax=Suillus subaureus TaxID=48587 RepID=A0A9P7E5U8_9AGAM|nr:uncharacterized protein BJ212DRAFT_1301773 [Suillus subaureus]KAG1811732.1 hypothetical protein BJ212DRAFT_1301773 [Suillus subaureus]